MSHQQYEACIKACQACALECEHCAAACSQEDNCKEMAQCIALDHDCAAICAMAVEMMARGSGFAKEVCRLCAQICRACGDECSKHEHMEHCKRCAEACYQCAEECERMAS
ncbi:putative cysteine-rich protein yhjQ [Legionella busanensis]|uniref:Putative cysteine-rich protein yhjQ n=1 Tax=Legionella busanensis TaxID=190655 RepID=A0A378JIV8_9GAMM|nr:four-helix bundle copper-binding protein [Legionella busanensis]STX50159.1 putative cysteine-rich protein yhjQ [Legionella busanensis]